MEALQHSFFDELRDASCRLPNGDPLPDLFDFTEEERSLVSEEVLARLVPVWYIKSPSK